MPLALVVIFAPAPLFVITPLNVPLFSTSPLLSIPTIAPPLFVTLFVFVIPPLIVPLFVNSPLFSTAPLIVPLFVNSSLLSTAPLILPALSTAPFLFVIPPFITVSAFVTNFAASLSNVTTVPLLFISTSLIFNVVAFSKLKPPLSPKFIVEVLPPSFLPLTLNIPASVSPMSDTL